MRILLPVSLDPSREDAGRLAADTARALRAEVLALFVVDTGGIRRSQAGAPPGAIHIAEMAEKEIAERLASEGEKEVAELFLVFQEAGVPCAGEVKAGDPREEIDKAAAGCDFLVTGLSSQYSFGSTDEPGKLVLSLMNEKVLPVLLAASPFRPVATVVIGCGGGPRTARAVGAMARFGLWRDGCRIVLLAVDDSQEKGRGRIAEPRRILADEGYSGWEEKVVPGPKADTFLAFCEEAGADAVVLGGWGEHRWHELFGLSITGRLVDSKRCHLFLHM
jgi:nucleotide-binding universal stress UspA family protein